MSLRLLSRLFLAAFFVVAAVPIFSQTVYHAEEGKLPLSFGGGVANFNPDYPRGTATGDGRMWGASAWADAGIRFGPAWLHPFNVELQYRSIFAGGTLAQANLNEGSYGGGVTYTWRHFRNFSPYGKYIMSLGTISFPPISVPGNPSYSHDSRFTNDLGGGFEYRLTRHIWARADYECDLWGHIYGLSEFAPQGFTVGAMYRLNKSPFLH
jgi:hypothetical protein